MRLWLVRHAVPLIAPGTCYGALDVAADTEATQQAARALARALPERIAVHRSTLLRCAALARALCELRPDLADQPDTRLHEMDFGKWEGQPWDTLAPAEINAWTADFAQYRPGGGESVDMFMTRVAGAYDEARANGRDAAWVTHAGVIRAAMLLHAGVRQPARASQWPVDAPGFGEWCVLEL